MADDHDGFVTIGDRLRQTAAELGDAVAMRSIRRPDDVGEISWRRLDERSDGVAARLLAIGVADRPATVVLITRDAVEHAIHAFGAWKAGQSVLCLSPGLGSVEGETILSRLGRTISFGASPAWDSSERVDESEPAPPIDRSRRVAAPMLILASGGSTGVPKLIDAIGAGQFRPGDFLGGLGTALRRRPRAKVFVCTPLSHGAGAATAYMGMFEQCEVTSLERFDPDVALWAIEHYGLEQLTVVPTMMDRISRSAGFDPARLSSITSLTHTGAVVDPRVKQVWIDAIGPEKVLEVYGSTESVGHAVISGTEWLEHPGSVGRPVNCDVRIVDPTGYDLPVGEVGEIFVRPLAAAVDPATKYIGSDQRMRSNGEHVSFGDLGSVDADGYLYIAGRTDDLIITGGVNVYPDELEIELRRLAPVADAVVVGRPDEDMGHIVHAVIAMRDGAEPLTLAEVREALAGRVSSYKLPRSLEVVSELVRSDAGKLRRAQFAPDPMVSR